jgi:hypothetical protein
MKRLTVALLVWIFTATVFAQTVEIIRGTERDYQNVSTPSIFAQSAEQEERDKIFSAWREIVGGAERHYRNKYGRYGKLAALRKAHLLRNLAVESCSSAASGTAKANFVPKSTLIEVLVSPDGQSFDVMILEHSGRCFGPPMFHLMPDFDDSPEGLIFAG